MTSRKREDLVSYPVPYECGGVLGQLLNRHRDLRDEANAISRKVAKLLGLNEAEKGGSDGVLSYTPDLPAETAACTV